MESQSLRVYTVCRAFVWALGALVAALATLVVVCLVQGQPAVKIGMLGFIILALGGVLLTSLFRRVEVDAERVTLYRLGRPKGLAISEITAAEALTVRSRAFLTLCAGDDFIILSNAYGRFAELLNLLVARVPPQSVSDELRAMAEAPPQRHADVWSCWLATGLVLVILWHQLTTGG